MYVRRKDVVQYSLCLLSHTLIVAFYSVGANSIGDDGIKSIATLFKPGNTLEGLQ